MNKPSAQMTLYGELASVGTVPALLRTLNMNHQPASAQKLALRAWLSEHSPNAALRLSLRSNGFGVLLNQIGVRRPMAPTALSQKMGA